MDALAVFTAIITAGITIVTLTDQRAYSRASLNKNPMDLMYSIMVMSTGHEESLKKAVRLAAAYEQKRRDAAAGVKGKPFTRMTPALA